ncbi:hypothetical protein ACLI09_09870 [Flavobacterium sp. RHBU_24]|uniref:hypothetical protein n=1 Tax=Flavobacterium sp. RHBU_24 TaxID=3391185 RepID=UPI0039855FAF
MKKISWILICLPLIVFGQEKSKFWYENDFTIETLKILATGIITFVISYIIFKLEKKKKEKKQISYDKEIKNGLLEVDKSIQNYITVKYKNDSTEHLSMVVVNIENTGDLVVKNQQIRFWFGENNKVIDTFNPPAKPELFLSELHSSKHFEKIYKIGHFEKHQLVNFIFIIEGKIDDVKLEPFNEEGNVEFNPRTVNKKREDKVVLQRFFIIGFFYFTIPSTLSGITQIGDLLAALISLIFIVLWYPVFYRTVVIFIDLLFSKSKTSTNVVFNGDRNVYSQDITERRDIK